MKPPDDGPLRTSRRALLAGAAGLAASSVVPRARSAAPTLSVMTRNLYLGVDIARLFGATSIDDLRRLAGEMLATIRAHPYDTRLEAIASEVDYTEPDVVGVQEAAILRVQEQSDFAEDPTANASTVIVDLLDRFAEKLADRGLDYDVATSIVTTDVEVPADEDGALRDVRLTDRDAVLVRSDVEIEDASSSRFDAALRVPLRGTSVAVRRGYCLADVSVGDAAVTVANTHLESTDDDIRTKQAAALLERLPTERPVVLAGDLNSGPSESSAAYDLLTDTFDDTVVSEQTDTSTHTCCQANDLRNEVSELSCRVDHVLAGGDLEPTAVERVGADPESKVTADVDGESVQMWPSDHAGVVSTMTLSGSTPKGTGAPAPGKSPTGTTTATATRTPTPESDGPSQLPLYGGVAGVGGLGLGLLAWYRRRR